MSAYETEYIRISNMKNIDYFISKPAHIEKSSWNNRGCYITPENRD